LAGAPTCRFADAAGMQGTVSFKNDIDIDHDQTSIERLHVHQPAQVPATVLLGRANP